MLADLKLCLAIFCVLAYCGQAASRCKPSNRCQNKGGTCYGRKEVPAGAEKIGNCKGKCKCYKEAAITTASVRSTVCTVSGPEKGHRCQFPFKSAGKWFNDCKVRGDKSWCPTEVDKSGRPKTSKWGYCGRCSEAVEMLPSFFPQCHFELKKNSTNKGAASDFFQKWQNNIVPYQFDSSFTSIDRQTFIVATQQIAATSCVSFIESSASQYLYVTRECACGGSCFSGGYTDGLGAASPRRLTIGSPCLDPNSQSSIGFVAHEILHALGIVHTQTRPDRNSFITVNENNIFPPTAGTKAQFERCPGCNTFGTAYDCSSIMHYRAYFFSQGSAYSMTALSPSTCDLFSSANVLTDSDKDLINKIYNCAAQTTPAPTPTPVTNTNTTTNHQYLSRKLWRKGPCRMLV
eukprot:GFUD01045128.1.p1 GENE.GFUD01045128.1~~GFUD01045128.1.p1  ORF type:complete len:404 (-),score=75.03 GFUD01045128.1:271-1482(-)